MNKEVPLKERIEKLYESGYVNEFNYLENQLQEARYLVTILHNQTEEKDKEIEKLSKELDMWNRKYNEQIDIIKELRNHFEMLKLNCDKAQQEFFEDIILYIDKLKELKEGK